MARRHSVVWTPSLHPRDLRGRFSVAREGARASSPDAKKERGKLQRKAALRASRGLVVGGVTAAVGYQVGSKKHVAAGLSRAGLAAAEGGHNIRSARRVTSNKFSRLSHEDQAAELKKRRRRSAQYAAVGGLSDAALTYSTGKIVRNKVSTLRANRTADANFTYMKGRTDQKIAAAQKTARFYERAKRKGKGAVYSKYQGPLPSKARKVGTKGSSAGVYNIASSGVRTASGPNKAKAGFAQRAAARAASRAANSPFVQRHTANAAVKITLAAQRNAGGRAPRVKRR